MQYDAWYVSPMHHTETFCYTIIFLLRLTQVATTNLASEKVPPKKTGREEKPKTKERTNERKTESKMIDSKRENTHTHTRCW